MVEIVLAFHNSLYLNVKIIIIDIMFNSYMDNKKRQLLPCVFSVRAALFYDVYCYFSTLLSIRPEYASSARML